jgi:hypothetical protein
MKSTTYDNIIAVDPDVESSGVTWLHPATKRMEIAALPFFELQDYLQHCKQISQEVIGNIHDHPELFV